MFDTQHSHIDISSNQNKLNGSFAYAFKNDPYGRPLIYLSYRHQGINTTYMNISTCKMIAFLSFTLNLLVTQ